MATAERGRERAASRRSEGAWKSRTVKSARLELSGISLSSPDRVVYPELGITKLELARYYEAVGDWLLPHFRDRPLTLVRCPDNYKQCFFQKHIDDNPVYEHVHAIPIQEEKGVGYYGAVDSITGVLSLVQLGTVEFHAWGSRRDKLEYPDKFTLDIDPDESVAWPRVVRAALAIRQLLLELGLESFVKTTGGKGLHVVVPITRRRKWDEVRAFTEAIAALLVEAAPKEYVMTLSKAKRRGKILIDYLRNARGAVAVEAYSARARAGATVATPIGWDELSPKVDPGRLNVKSLPKRLRSLGGDPWAGYFGARQSITAEMMRRLGAAGA